MFGVTETSKCDCTTAMCNFPSPYCMQLSHCPLHLAPLYRLGLVSQEPTLFDGTIAENIKFGMREATQVEIEEAAKKANAHNFITKFPEGYNTLVGSASSSQISGGQKQRVAVGFKRI